MSRSSALRVIAVIGLLSAAFFALLPWLGCLNEDPLGIVDFARDDFFWPRVCTVGLSGPLSPFGVSALRGPGLPGFTGPYWGNLVIGIAYLVAAVYVAVTKRL